MANQYKYLSLEEKSNIITPVLTAEISFKAQAKRYGFSHGLISNWIKAYREMGK